MFVVTGATGNVGRSLVRVLAAAGAPVTATSRGISDADVPENVQYTRADLVDPESLRPVFDGADALFLQSGGPSAHLLSPQDILGVAKAGGVGRVVLLSSQGVATRPHSASHGDLGRSIEDAVRQSGMDWTILRPGGFNSNAYAWAESVRARRTAGAPFADIGLPTVDPDDIAEVAAAALREDGHAGQIYELTGPALSTPRQRAAAIADALGEPVGFIEQTRDEAHAQMLRFMPEPVVEATLSILGEPTPAEQRISPDVERLLGRAPRTFADWAQRHIGAFR
ncbi:NAD(P)H-binding protein [Streptomyces sp. WI04-05B]|uniref:NAD(P)H-binding protein n=1 Tax=Streptomyces TaxID=1883 RepID=UPI0029B2BAC0|nr:MULTISPECIES: NAD(P)H-binding protein [unclassified Streptomyces]MDX2543863.1 NAD(P)H-binding protein [Streptomyces sp. WI04-05B]MDX2582047.1 NAD(P)H-binding protein [Streptomyces sp. WI04-05A]MDX3752459.1 NAD(P)H-binding protein [Streptomyces sp. AK08-02]